MSGGRPGAPAGRGAAPGAFGVTVDVAVFTVRDGLLAALLVVRAEEPFAGQWALPGGFVGAAESLQEAALRVLAEETGLPGEFGGYLEQLRSYGAPGRDPRARVVSVAHVALAPDLPDARPGRDTAAARWWPVEDLAVAPAGDGAGVVELAFDHGAILADALERVRSKLEYTSLATAFVAEPFTLADLRRVYAAVWGVAPDLGEFRRTVLSTEGFVVPVGGAPGGGRTPLLYRRGSAVMLQPAMLRPRDG